LSMFIGCFINGCAQTQVVNNSGTLLYKAQVGSVEFSENLDSCGDGCSTGFKRVQAGDRTISLKETMSSPWRTIDTVGPFERWQFYAVNLRTVTHSVGPHRTEYCVELWKRADTGGEFNSDTTKTLVVSHCPNTAPSGGGHSPESMVTNSSGSGSLLHAVRIGGDDGVVFTENLDLCGTGCSSGFAAVSAGDNDIALQVMSTSDWATLSDPLGPFENGAFYSVNITSPNEGIFCATLWKLSDPDLTFDEDPDKQEIESGCFE